MEAVYMWQTMTAADYMKGLIRKAAVEIRKIHKRQCLRHGMDAVTQQK